MTSGSAASGTAATGWNALQLSSNTSPNEGASKALTGAFLAGHTYTAVLWAKGAASGQAWRFYLGYPSGGAYASAATTSNGAWQKLTVSWTPGATYASGVLAALRVNDGQATANTATIDDLEVWDGASADRNVPSLTAYDADGHPVASVLPGGHAGDPPMVTRTAYDSVGRITDVTVDALAGAGTGSTDVNLVTHTAWDNLGRKTQVTNPKAVVSAYAYDRLGRVTSTIDGYHDGVWSGTNPDQDVKSTFAYDALGELIAYCPARNQVGGFTCDPTNPSDANAWHWAFDAAGHVATQVAPVATLLATGNRLAVSAWAYDAGNRLVQVCSYPTSGSSCTSATRYTTTSYDNVGRAYQTKTYAGAPGSGTLKLSWTNAYQGDGFRTQVAFDGTSSGEGTDTLDFTPDALDRLTTLKRGAATLTGYVYNPDDTASSRTDSSGAVTSLLYDWAGRPTSTASSSISASAATFAYRLDGLYDTRAWSGTNAAGAFSYDGAKRPTQLAISGSGVASATLTQSYDRAGNVASEGRTFTGISGNAGANTQTFSNDELNRVTQAVLNSVSTTYTYDPDGNRLTSAVGGTTTSYVYDATDQLISKQVGAGTIVASNYDPYGNVVANAESYAFGVTAYTYDLGDRLTALTPPAGQASGATYTLDALGRLGSRTISGTTDAYAYLGTTETVSRITTAGSSTDALLGADGSRYATKTASGFGWLLADLHGNVAGASSSTLGAISDALRYDAYGQVTASVTSSLPTPWRYQGRLLVDPSGANDLYDAGARFYSPGLGVFTQLDTVQGSALDPLSLNRYLYAAADPETLVDPSGHSWLDDVWNGATGFVGGTAQYVAGVAVGVVETGVNVGVSTAQFVACEANPFCGIPANIQMGQNAAQFASDPIGNLRRGAISLGDWVGGESATLGDTQHPFEAGRAAGNILAAVEVTGFALRGGLGNLRGLQSEGDLASEAAVPRSGYPARRLPTDPENTGDPFPDTDAPHSQLATHGSRGTFYPAAREWLHDPESGRLVPTRDLHFTDHGRPQTHPNPHQHVLDPNNPRLAPRGGYEHGVATGLEYN